MVTDTGAGGMVGRRGIHISDINQFRTCRFRWNVTSHLRRNLESRGFTAPLWLGTGVHEALAAFYGEGIDVVEAFGEWAEEQKRLIRKRKPNIELEKVDEQIELGIGMLEHYKHWADLNDDFEVVEVEKVFRIQQFVEGEPLEGRGDMIIRHEGQLKIMEHKTAISIQTERLILEEQPGAYQIGMQSRFDEPIVGTRYNFLRKKLPTVPKELKTGGTSRNKSIDTTWDVYKGALLVRGEDPADYDEMRVMIQQHEENRPFFYREDVVRNRANLRILWEGMQATGREMLDPDIPIYAAPDTIKCQMCNVQGVCITYHDGGDFEAALKEQFVERTEDYAPTEEEELAWVL